jgi:3',5'-cyclic AMP phosphodiesterase CpdA
MRILHASDIHVCRPGDWRRLRGKRLAGWLNWLLRRGRQHDPARWDSFLDRALAGGAEVLLLTGDLAQLGTAAELAEAAAPLQRLADAGRRVLYVPGNHDRYLRGDAEAEAAVARLWEAGGGEEEAPGVRVVRHGEVEFVLLAQARPASWWSAGGGMEPAQWRALERLGARGLPAGVRHRLVAGHYPLLDPRGRPLKRSRRLAGDRRLQLLLAGLRARLYLCGHIHTPYARPLPDGGEQLVAGSLTAKGIYYRIEAGDAELAWHRETLSPEETDDA